MEEAGEIEILLKFGENLQKIREGKGLSLRELAAIAGVEHALIHRIEKGQTNTKLLTILRIASALEIDPCKLLKY